MADHGSSGAHTGSHGLADHTSTYEGFVKGAFVLVILSAYVLVALVAFRFVGSGNLLLGFGGLILGVIAVLVDARAGNRWFLSGGLLVVFGLITGAVVS
jgi:hypothetical protein